jgi:predicted MFS family arabinose efflux permease
MMLQDAGLTLAGGGLLASANYIGYLLGALTAMAVRIPHATAIRGGLLVIGATTLAMGAHLPLEAWLLMRLIAGVASAWVLISVSAWSLETLARYQRPILSSVIFAGVGIGIMIAGLLCIALIHADADSSRAWMALGLFSLIVTAAIWRFFARHDMPAGEAEPAGQGGFRWDAESIRLVLCYGLFGFGYIIPATFLPVMAKRALQDATLFGWSWPIFGAAAALSTLAVAMVVRRLGSRRLWAVCHFIMALGVALPVVWPHVLAVFLAALLVGSTFTVITLCAMWEAKRVAGNAATALIAAMTSVFAAGQIAGPLYVAYISRSDQDFSEALLAAALLLAISGYALARKPAVKNQ